MTPMAMLRRDEVRTGARPHVVVAALIQMLPELGCRLTAVEDFGTTVRFTCPRLGAVTPPVLVAWVRPAGDGAAVSIRRVTPALDPSDDERVDRAIGPVLVELARRVRDQS